MGMLVHGKGSEQVRLPSNLHEKYSSFLKLKKPLSSNEAEVGIQEVFSSLASLRELPEGHTPDGAEQSRIIDKWWECLSEKPDENGFNPGDITHEIYHDSEWEFGARIISLLMEYLSPFEAHLLATQSITMVDDSDQTSSSFQSFCVLLCAHVLRCRAPPNVNDGFNPIQTRWKRWQSLVCETIRIFKQIPVSDPFSASKLWTSYVIPSCVSVAIRLPKDALRPAILSGILSTTSQLAFHIFELFSENGMIEPSHFGILSNSVGSLSECFRGFAYSCNEDCDVIPWSFPWMEFDETHKPVTITMFDDEDELFESRRGDLAWWACREDPHERVAEMDTKWNSLGISVMASIAYGRRPQIYSPAFTWKLFFPHASNLLQSNGQSSLQAMGQQLLEDMIGSTPSYSLQIGYARGANPCLPFEIFHILSSQLKSHQELSDSGIGRKLAMRLRKQTVDSVSTMKFLLSRYSPTDQVSIVERLVSDSAHQGLQAKFVDLLRPILFRQDSYDALWRYVSSIIQQMRDHFSADGEKVLDMPGLMKGIEIYVAAVTSVQLWYMVKGNIPEHIDKSHLSAAQKALVNLPPLGHSGCQPVNEGFRLNLLEAALVDLTNALESSRNTDVQK